MTIIVTLINRFGIVHGTDSNISYNNADGRQVEQERKLFDLGDDRGAVAVAGNWFIENEFMHTWMPNFIEEERKRGDFTLRSFARNLAARWHKGIPTERRTPQGNWAHIAGFERTDDGAHPEFWAVTNVRAQNLEGPTDIDVSRFHHWEDISTRDCRTIRETNQPYDLYAEFAHGHPSFALYMNGHGDGRLLTNVLFQFEQVRDRIGPVLRDFLSRAPAQTARRNGGVRAENVAAHLEQVVQFASPTSLEQTEELVRRSIELIGTAFQAREDARIGGAVQIFPIMRPNDMVNSCQTCPMYTAEVIDNNLDPVFPDRR